MYNAKRSATNDSAVHTSTLAASAEPTNRRRGLLGSMTTMLMVLAAVLAMVATMVPAASADPGDDDDGKIILPHQLEPDDTEPPPPGPGADTPIAQRRYKVTVDKFWVKNESGWDWPGSDEVVWHFAASNGVGETDLTTGEYGDVDDGETIEMGDICITPGGCNVGGGGDLLLTATAVEMDGPLSTLAPTVAGLSNMSYFLYSQFGPADWVNPGPRFQQEAGQYLASVLDNDVIGSDILAMTEEDLSIQVPYIGSNRMRVLDAKGWGGDFPLGGDAHYRLYVNVTRVADAESAVSQTTVGSTIGGVATASSTGSAGSVGDLGVSLEPEEDEPQGVVRGSRGSFSSVGNAATGKGR
jgi:hypothetical protein